MLEIECVLQMVCVREIVFVGNWVCLRGMECVPGYALHRRVLLSHRISPGGLGGGPRCDSNCGRTWARHGPGVAQAWARRGPGVAQVCLNGLSSDSVRLSPISFACLCNSFIYLCLHTHTHACACKFPDTLCIEGFYTDIGSPLVAPEGGRVVVQTAAGRGPGVAQVCLKVLVHNSVRYFANSPMCSERAYKHMYVYIHIYLFFNIYICMYIRDRNEAGAGDRPAPSSRICSA